MTRATLGNPGRLPAGGVVLFQEQWSLGVPVRLLVLQNPPEEPRVSNTALPPPSAKLSTWERGEPRSPLLLAH